VESALTVSNKASVCGFCGGSGVTKEHVWPDWLRKLILDSRSSIGQKTFTMEVENAARTARFASTTLESTVKMPCAMCNNGWMSALEVDVKTFMAGMVFPGVKTMLTHERQSLLTRWAVKTAMVFEWVAKPAPYFTADERATFRAFQQIPSNVRVWLGRYDAMQPAHALQHRIGLVRENGRISQAYCLTLTANFLAMQVFAYRDPGPSGERIPVTPGPWKEALLRISPVGADLMIWPPKLTMDNRDLEVLDHRFVCDRK